MTLKPFDRRKFLKVSTTTVASLLVGCPEKSTVKRWKTAGRSAAPAGAPVPEESPNSPTPNCAKTSRDITGPYWRKGIPVRHQFDLYDDSGQTLSLSGVVLDERCRPIQNAVIEMWHASPTVALADALSPADSVDYDLGSSTFRYYGQFATGQRGEYSMSTKKPGWYLNGDAFRPSHIHVKIYVEGVERLTTQLYFEDDPFIAEDPWASVAPERVLVLKSTPKGHLSSRFDFTVSTIS